MPEMEEITIEEQAGCGCETETRAGCASAVDTPARPDAKPC